MIKEEKVETAGKALKRIFAMKVTRSTFREVQNSILQAVEGDAEQANMIFESLLSGKAKEGATKGKATEALTKIVTEYCIPVRLAKEVTERGEFISLITSDMFTQADKIAFLNWVRRIDGEDFRFLADLESMVNLVGHIVGRVQELEKSEKGKDLVDPLREQIGRIAEALTEVASQKVG